MSERLTIVCLSSQPWEDDMWTNKQHVMSRVAKLHRVIYVNFGNQSPFKFTRRARKLEPAWALRSLWKRPVVRKLEGSLEVLDIWAPTWLNFLGRGHALRAWNDFERRVDVLGAWLREQQISDAVVWVYHPGYGAAVSRLSRRLVVYDCVDEYSAFPEFKGAEAWISGRERDLCRIAGVVTCTAPALYETKRLLAPGRTHLVHNVGDFEHFQKASDAATQVPVDLASCSRPIVGFIGAVSDYKLNLDWLLELARAKPEWTVVVIGPTGVADPGTDVARLAAMPNVRLMGHRSYATLPSYLKGFDVAVIPYRINDYTRAVFPIKFFEFLASGKPVVISALPAVQTYWDATLVAETAEDFVTKCALAIEHDSPPARDRRLQLARENSWPERVRKLLELVEQAIAAPPSLPSP
jgi:glycosyltransferase involved in cell wall biosynthesis